MESINVIPPAQIDWIQGKTNVWDTPKLPANENTFKNVSKFFPDKANLITSFNKLSLNNDKSVSWTETSESRIISLRTPIIHQALKKAFNESEIVPIEEHKSGELAPDEQHNIESSSMSLSIKDLMKDLKTSKFAMRINTDVKNMTNRPNHLLSKSKSSLSYEYSPIGGFLTPNEISYSIK